MQPSYPHTPGNMHTALQASLAVQLAFSKLGVACFDWPQSMDSGIDLVAFSTFAAPTDVEWRATAFTAGIQVKGTGTAPADDGIERVHVGSHSDYWQRGTMPVFVAQVNTGTDDIRIEDAVSVLSKQRHLNPGERTQTAIPASALVSVVGEHVRLRMLTHALAPYLSPKLRVRALAEVVSADGAAAESVWTALAKCAEPGSSFAIPRSWNEASQFFGLVEHMLHDARMHDDFGAEVRRVRDIYRADGGGSAPLNDEWDGSEPHSEMAAPMVLVAAVEMLLKLLEFQRDPMRAPFDVQPIDDPNVVLRIEATREPDARYRRLVIEGAIDAIAAMWSIVTEALGAHDAQVDEFLQRSPESVRGPAVSLIHALAAEGPRDVDDIVAALRCLLWHQEDDFTFEARHWMCSAASFPAMPGCRHRRHGGGDAVDLPLLPRH